LYDSLWYPIIAPKKDANVSVINFLSIIVRCAYFVLPQKEELIIMINQFIEWKNTERERIAYFGSIKKLSILGISSFFS